MVEAVYFINYASTNVIELIYQKRIISLICTVSKLYWNVFLSGGKSKINKTRLLLFQRSHINYVNVISQPVVIWNCLHSTMSQKQSKTHGFLWIPKAAFWAFQSENRGVCSSINTGVLLVGRSGTVIGEGSVHGSKCLPSMLRLAMVLSVSQSQTYWPLSLSPTLLMIRIRRLSSAFIVTIFEALISASL